MARPGYYTGGSSELPLGCIIAMFAVMIPVGLGVVAFEVWWRFTLFAAVLKYLHG